MAKSIVGRTHEIALFDEVLKSGRAELVALYGRRRVGKTYLVRNHLAPRAGTYLEVTGTLNGSAALQRRRFREAVEAAFNNNQPLPDLPSWEDALSYLTTLVEARAQARPRETIVLFFDELPWLSTARSRLLEALDYHWNRRLSQVDQVKVVLCGSAASWMLRRIVHARGGLHNRLTRSIRLEPFTVRDANAYLQSRRVRLAPLEMLQLYMTLGGVPYYLNLVERGRSVPDVVGRLAFEQGGPLQSEFQDVFQSLFYHHDEHITLLRALARKREGLTRNELLAATGLTSGGGVNRRLQELEEAGFVGRVEPFAAIKKNAMYRVIDEYTLFYLKWMERAPKGVLARGGAAHWRSVSQTPAYTAWAGYAFESLCYKHALELIRALDIENLVTSVGTWRHVPKNRSARRQGAQVDLLFERRDGVVHLIEIKFVGAPFVVTRAYAQSLKEKVQLFEQQSKVRARIIVTLVAPFGLKTNAWSEGLIDRVVDISSLLGDQRHR